MCSAPEDLRSTISRGWKKYLAKKRCTFFFFFLSNYRSCISRATCLLQGRNSSSRNDVARKRVDSRRDNSLDVAGLSHAVKRRTLAPSTLSNEMRSCVEQDEATVFYFWDANVIRHQQQHRLPSARPSLLNEEDSIFSADKEQCSWWEAHHIVATTGHDERRRRRHCARWSIIVAASVQKAAEDLFIYIVGPSRRKAFLPMIWYTRLSRPAGPLATRMVMHLDGSADIPFQTDKGQKKKESFARLLFLFHL